MECTGHIGGEGLITIHLLASPVQLFFLEGSGFLSCISVFFNFCLTNFSISVTSGLSDMVAEEAERSVQMRKSELLSDRHRVDCHL